MLSEKDILNTLDAAAPAGGYSFIDLGHVYSYLIDCRLNIFRGADNRWAIAAERLGFSPRAGAVQLEILYFCNCLHANNQEGNYYCTEPIEWESFSETTDGEIWRANAQHWLVRDQQIPLEFEEQYYAAAGISRLWTSLAQSGLKKRQECWLPGIANCSGQLTRNFTNRCRLI